MRGLSILQPWASLIAIGAKRVETRSWWCEYRGLVAIHASKTFSNEYRALSLESPFREALRAGGYQRLGDLPRGAIIAVARIEAIWRTDSLAGRAISGRELAFGNFTEGRYGWSLVEVRRLPTPLPCDGSRGLWKVSFDMQARIAATFAAAEGAALR